MSTKQQPKLISGFPEEIRYILETNWELVLKTQVEPRGGALLQGLALSDADKKSSGTAKYGKNIGEPLDPDASLGVRFWPASPGKVHDVYGTPEGKEFNESPHLTAGVVRFNEESDKEILANEWGMEVTRRAEMWIPSWEHLERDLPEPDEGDLVEFWGDSWHEFGMFFEVIESSRQGFIHNTSYFVNWHLTLQRNDQFLPERRLLGNRS